MTFSAGLFRPETGIVMPITVRKGGIDRKTGLTLLDPHRVFCQRRIDKRGGCEESESRRNPQKCFTAQRRLQGNFPLNLAVVPPLLEGVLSQCQDRSPSQFLRLPTPSSVISRIKLQL